MKDTTFFAVFEPSKTGFSVYFPDLPGCITVGKNIEDARKNAEEVLGLHLWGMERDNDEIPKATTPPFADEEPEAGAFVMPITIIMDLVKNEIENKSVKKTLTIPYWLNNLAEKEEVNFSRVLQVALMEYLHVNTEYIKK